MSTSSSSVALPNRRYYLEIGQGKWTGRFSFHLTDWAAFWKDQLGLPNRLLALMMVVWQKIFGDSTISSDLVGNLTDNRASNVVRIHKFGVVLYILKEEYLLHQDGRNVTVISWERFGPVPFLFSGRKNLSIAIVFRLLRLIASLTKRWPNPKPAK